MVWLKLCPVSKPLSFRLIANSYYEDSSCMSKVAVWALVDVCTAKIRRGAGFTYRMTISWR